MADKIKKLTQREHILQLPDTYIGSRDCQTENRWVYNPAEAKMEWREVQMNPGLFKIFDEIIVNALDHVTRQSQTESKVSNIRVTLASDHFTVFNDGDGIPVTVHPEYKVMIPELIFGQLLTSSNYDEAEEKTVGGKNGYGAKLTNIYSTCFIVKTGDAARKVSYEQFFTDNMSIIGTPTMKKMTVKPFTEITSYPDLKRFYPGSDGQIPKDMLDIMLTRVVDAAALCSSAGVTVSYRLLEEDSFVKVPVKNFESYVKLFLNGGPVFYERCGPRWEIAAVLTRNLLVDEVPDDRHISFVNGIFTRRGGKHVDTVSRAVLGAFCEGPGKKLDLKPAQLKDAVTFFVNATIVNPSFDSQTKETLTTPVAKFGSVFKVSDAFVAKLAKDGGLLDEAQAILDARRSKDAKKTDGRKAATVRGIPKLEDATWAGTAKSSECILILTEGDSAASTAISGLKVVGRERYGVFPLKGKILNVKDATMEKKTKNEELTRIKRILGLEHGKVYKDVKSLRYGKVMIMTDQDVDGSHIKGLLINLFHTEWPTLLPLNFLCCMMTPLLKVTKGPTTLSFYSGSEYEAWLKTPESAGRWSTKYYKGLGTSTAAEARDYFVSMNTVRFQWDETSDGNIDLAFNKKRADDRKDWLSTYDRDRNLDIPAGGADVSYSRFINDELIHFSNADNLRSLPHVMDGLKPSQRKILWAARKRNLVSEIKVAQLAGYVSENAAYHHGEVSLTAAIVNMAQNFVGSNNINLLIPNGQFGTRLQGGDDAASARYIFTSLEPIGASVFSKADDPGLTWLEDDGQTVEPEYYLPVIPMLLVNGSVGIGTGFSTEILPYNPKDLVSCLKRRLMGTLEDMTDIRLTPWWDGFKGPILVTGEGKQVVTKGIYQFLDDDTNRVRITELPVGTWTKVYKAFLDELLSGVRESESASAGKYLKSFQEAYNDVDVEFVLTLDAEYYSEARAFPAEFEKKFKLTSSYKLSNMVAFHDGHIRRFDGTGEILEAFYERRLAGYVARKASELARMDAEIVEVDARARFIKAVVDGTLIVSNAADEDLLADMMDLGLPRLSKAGDTPSLADFEYVLKLRIDRLKAKAVLDLQAELELLKGQRSTLDAKSPETLWITDLNMFSVAYDKFQGAREAARVSEPKKVVKKVKK